jgi:hypothetical protein
VVKRFAKKERKQDCKKESERTTNLFQPHLGPEVKTMMGSGNTKQIKKRKSTDSEIIDWMLAIDLDPSQIQFLFF